MTLRIGDIARDAGIIGPFAPAVRALADAVSSLRGAVDFVAACVAAEVEPG